MNIFIVSALFAFIFSLVIVIFVLLKGKKSIERNSFISVALLAGIWCLFPFAASLFSPVSDALILVRTVYIAAIFTAPAFLRFGLVMVEADKGKFEKNLIRIVYITAVLFLPFLFSPLMIHSIIKKGPYFTMGVGPIYSVFIVLFALTCSYAFFRLLIKLKRSKGQKKNQIKYVFIAYFFAFLSAVVHFGSAYGLREVFPHDILVIMCVVLLSYAILAHRLMDIEFIIKKTLVFAGLFMAAYAVFSTFAYIGSIVFETIIQNRWIALIPSVFVIVLILRPLETFLRNITDKHLFQKKYDYKKLLRTFTNEVLSVLDLKDLLAITVNKLTEIVRLENASILLFYSEDKEFRVESSAGLQLETGYSLKASDTFIRHIQTIKNFILFDENDKMNSVARNAMDKLASDLIFLLRYRQDIIGLLCLGKKKSDEEFTPDDIDIFLPLARTLAIAISNAKLFSKLSESQAQAAQTEKMAVIGTLSAGINHEICNPLGIARGQCEMFLLNMDEGIYKDKPPEELLARVREIMKKVMHETDRATIITRKLSSFAKPARGETDGIVDVENELNEVISLIEHDLKLESIKIEKSMPKKALFIKGDRKQVQEIFFNIIRNAVQAMQGGGTLLIRVACRGKKVNIMIKDTGEGIDKKNLTRIFNPFFTTKEPGKGTGLGLFIVKQIVEKNNGKIDVESELGKGTAFYLTFTKAGH
ncbi:MAG: ATP-binding protein [Candidatus Omnitrophota bacterium]